MVPKIGLDLPPAKRMRPLQCNGENRALQGKQHSGQKFYIADAAVSKLPDDQINAAYQTIYAEDEKAIPSAEARDLSGQSPKSLLRIGIAGYERTNRRVQAQYGKAYRHIVKTVKLTEYKG